MMREHVVTIPASLGDATRCERIAKLLAERLDKRYGLPFEALNNLHEWVIELPGGRRITKPQLSIVRAFAAGWIDALEFVG